MHLFDIQFDFKELEPKMRRWKRWAQDEEFNMQLQLLLGRGIYRIKIISSSIFKTSKIMS